MYQRWRRPLGRRGHRLQRRHDLESASTYTHYYYAAGQVVETRVTDSALRAPAFVTRLSIRLVGMTDAPILRDTISGAASRSPATITT